MYTMARDKKSVMIEFVTMDVLLGIIEETSVSFREAMNMFYNSEVFEQLCDTETGLYRESGGYVYDLFKNERENGRLVQLEH